MQRSRAQVGRGGSAALAPTWLKNRRPDLLRDVQQVDAQLGHYVISERPMTEEDWIRAHASNAADLELELLPSNVNRQVENEKEPKLISFNNRRNELNGICLFR